MPQATYTFMLVNGLIFAAQLASGGSAGSLGGGSDQLVLDGGLNGPAVAIRDEWYRIITSGFLHVNLIHVALNLYVLWILGTLLEPAIGTARFVGVYLVSLVVGSWGALLLDPNALTVGASGAVYGLMAATILVARNRGLGPIVSQLGLWLAINLLFTFSVDGISVGGHLGGLVGGALAALLVLAGERTQDRRTLAYESAGLAVIGGVAFLGALLAADASVSASTISL